MDEERGKSRFITPQDRRDDWRWFAGAVLLLSVLTALGVWLWNHIGLIGAALTTLGVALGLVVFFSGFSDHESPD